jgi:TolA-binding protein
MSEALMPNWIQQLAALGGMSTITGLLTWWTTHRMALANIRKMDGEGLHTEVVRSADFEQALNDRTTKLLDSLDRQITHLSAVVEAQTAQIHQMEAEIRDLRTALSKRSLELLSLQSASQSGSSSNLT